MTPGGGNALVMTWPGRKALASKNMAVNSPAGVPLTGVLLMVVKPVPSPTKSPRRKACCSGGGTRMADGVRVKFSGLDPSLNRMNRPRNDPSGPIR
jgi:hypothetical protein